MRTGRVSDERRRALRAIPAFAECTNRQLAAIDQRMTAVVLGPGKRLTQQGRPARQCMIIESGTVAVHRDGLEVGLLGPGEWIDGDAVFAHGDSRMTAVALTKVTLDVMLPSELSTIISEVPAIAHAVHGRQVIHLGAAGPARGRATRRVPAAPSPALPA